MTEHTVIQAWYESSPISEYAGNPLIEALPPIISEEEAIDQISVIPNEVGDERRLPKQLRLHCISRLSHLIQPLPIHLELEAAISSLIRGGYVGRNPMHAAVWRQLHAVTARRDLPDTFNSTASTFSLVGLSGMGKTTALYSVLRHYPQVIKHTRYGGRDFIHTQIVWLKVECPFDGGLGGLCRNFFRAVDTALGRDEYSRFYHGRMGIPDLIASMEKVASTYFIGGLFIDEMQHLVSNRGVGREHMLNFFVNLVNGIGVPVVFVGTNSMIELFGTVLRNARRASGLSIFDFKQPVENDAAWELLVDVMWRYQWVARPVPLTEELRKTIYDLTQGVTDFLAKLMILGQRYAIQSGRETLDESVLTHVASSKMKLLAPAIAALRSRDRKQMGRFEDLLPTDAQLVEMMKGDNSVLSERVSLLRKQLKNSLDAERTSSDDAQADKIPATPLRIVPSAPDSRQLPLVARLNSETTALELLKQEGCVLIDSMEFNSAYRE